MGSIGVKTTLSKNSTSNGVILTAAVKSDPRYQAVENIFPDGFKSYYPEDILRTLMKAEENGQTTGTYHVTDSGNARLSAGIKTFGGELNLIKQAFKSAGYKVTKSVSTGTHTFRSAGVRGRSRSASTTKSRNLSWEKI